MFCFRFDRPVFGVGCLDVLLFCQVASAQQLPGAIGSGVQAVNRGLPVSDSPPIVPRTLGTFYETPYMTVGGNGVTGGLGYTPLQQYGDGTMSLYGPFSSLRATTAPVLLYRRSVGGQLQPELGTSTSYPFMPSLSPVKYPTRGMIRGESRSLNRYFPGDTGFNWVDQN